MDLQDIVNNGPAWASTRAKMALKFKELHGNGLIGDGEYNELLEDLIRTDDMLQSADDIDFNAKLVTAIKAIMLVV